jgi:hypothetical protein
MRHGRPAHPHGPHSPELSGQNSFTRASRVGKHARIVSKVIEPA